ncbi:MAG: hypothetical protein JNK92_04480 [Dechloromonas sp.]|nr:hypothetical protein [Dechloromonas sp.]
MSNHRLGPALLLSLLFIVSPPALALQPLVSDDTGTQGSGGIQVELAYSAFRQRLSGSTNRLDSLPFTYTRGVSETLDLFVSASYGRLRPAGSSAVYGAGTPSIGAKWRFMGTEEDDTRLGVKPEIFFPINGSAREADGFAAGNTSGRLTFLLEQKVPFGVVLVNAFVGRNRRHGMFDGSGDSTTTGLSLAPIWEVSGEWRLALDMGQSYQRGGGSTTIGRYLEAAAIYSIDKDLELALGIIGASDNQNPRTTTRPRHSASPGDSSKHLAVSA